MINKEMAFLIDFAKENKLIHLLESIDAATLLHEGQKRKDGEPYINHPLRVTSALVRLNILDDTILATAMLHDVIEDCNITPEELELKYNLNCEIIKNIVALTKIPGMSIEKYYGDIMNHPKALLIKISDRCHNISTMVKSFSLEKMKNYCDETEDYILPLLKYGRKFYPNYSNQLFSMKYHIESVLDAIKGFIEILEKRKEN